MKDFGILIASFIARPLLLATISNFSGRSKILDNLRYYLLLHRGHD